MLMLRHLKKASSVVEAQNVAELKRSQLLDVRMEPGLLEVRGPSWRSDQIKQGGACMQSGYPVYMHAARFKEVFLCRRARWETEAVAPYLTISASLV